jgi:hypothetical protein
MYQWRNMMAKRIALIIGVIGFVATIVGLYADISDLIGGDDEPSTIEQTNEAADLIIQSFNAELAPSQRELLADVQVFNQGDVAAINGTVTVMVEIEGVSDILTDTQSFQSIVAGTSATFSFVFDISGNPNWTAFEVYAIAESSEGTFTSNRQKLTKR